MDELMAWKQFELSGRVDDYLSYSSLLHTIPEEGKLHAHHDHRADRPGEGRR